jgi:N-acetyl-anhydromuramyl-L-alanine amidase AmpD
MSCQSIDPDASLWLRRGIFPFSLAVTLAVVSGCGTSRPGAYEPRKGDEIVIAGRFFHTGTPVVLWMDPGGYDAYRVENRFGPYEKSDWQTASQENPDLKAPARYGLRRDQLSTNEIERVRGGGWDLALLQRTVDQFVIHFDVCGVSRQCFNVLHDHRDLSVHFMLDLDGTIYQTLDVKERAWHASTSNDRSVGVEIANMGAYDGDEKNPLDEWYRHESNGLTTITIPERLGDGGIRTLPFTGHPARPEPVHGNIQGRELIQYDFTPQQYEALAKLTATLCTALPRIECKYPVDATGRLVPRKLEDADLANYHGVLGHYHIQTNKVDPGPAFDWERVIGRARYYMQGKPLPPKELP